MKIDLPGDWSGMFLLGAAETPAGARPVPMPSIELAVFDPLRAIPVRDVEGRQIGAFLGNPVDPDRGTVPRDVVTLSEAAPRGDPDGFVERHVYAFTGSYLFVLDLPTARRLYLDACGSLSAVFEPGSGRAAAISAQLVAPDEVSARFDTELYEALRVDRDGWFPAALTGHHGIARLLPNHYLDLDTGRAVRHWPHGPIPETPDPEAACRDILAAMRGTMAALAAEAPLSIALTAGNETRMLVAASRGMAGDRAFVTVEGDGRDRDRAVEIARRFGLPHRLVPLRLADAAGQRDWQARAAYAVGGGHVRTFPTIHQLRDRRYLVGGSAGEVGRGFFWRRTDTDATPVDADGIWARMGLPRHPRGIAAVARWLDALRRDLGELPALLILDLAYLELRMGGWGYALSYTNTAPIAVHPLVGRASFTSMLSLPARWRRQDGTSNRMVRSVVALGWPELLEIPIGAGATLRNWPGLLGRAVRQPHLVARKLRKALS